MGALAVAPVLASAAHGSPWEIALAGLVVGVLVGLTGAGGGALLTPVLVVVFGLPGLAAVGSDLVASVVMKPVGGLVHLKRGRVRTDIAKWLAVGSAPGAILGVTLLWLVGKPAATAVEPLIGVVLVATAAVMVVRPLLARRAAQRVEGEASPDEDLLRASARIGGRLAGTAAVDGPGAMAVRAPRLRPLPTAAVGLVGGLLVGLTSVGSGTLMLAALTLCYPGLTTEELVGTDLVQAIPLVAVAALAHLVLGDVRISVSLALLAGAIPGTYAGARWSSRRRASAVRPAMILFIVTSGVALLAS